MKKIMFAAALAAAFAATADIESANTVGYTTRSVVQGNFYLIAVQFSETGAASEGADLNALIKLSSEFTPGTYADDFVGAPDIQVLNATGTGYKHYYYISDATDDNDKELGYNCWADSDGYALTDADKLALGKGFWLKATATGTITVMGDVAGSASKVISFPANQFFIMANPFPKATSFADVITSGITTSTYAADFAGASDIQVLNASATGYKHYYYISDATDDNDDEVGYNCWADSDGYILSGTQVEAGASFWIKANAAGTMGFTR